MHRPTHVMNAPGCFNLNSISDTIWPCQTHVGYVGVCICRMRPEMGNGAFTLWVLRMFYEILFLTINMYAFLFSEAANAIQLMAKQNTNIWQISLSLS